MPNPRWYNPDASDAEFIAETEGREGREIGSKGVGAEPPLTPWPKPTESQKEGGWKINLDFLKAIERDELVEAQGGSDWETIEAILLAAGKQESP